MRLATLYGGKLGDETTHFDICLAAEQHNGLFRYRPILPDVCARGVISGGKVGHHEGAFPPTHKDAWTVGY